MVNNCIVRGMATVLVSTLLLVYCVGMFDDTWRGVYRSDTGELIAYMGIFRACGYNFSLQVPTNTFISTDRCFSLLDSEVTESWIQAMQFCAIVCFFHLCTATVLWAYMVAYEDFNSPRCCCPLLTVAIPTGIWLTINPIIFANNTPPDQEVEIVSTECPPLYNTVTTTTMYWPAFYLHCIVAGVFNSLTLPCVFCMFRTK